MKNLFIILVISMTFLTSCYTTKLIPVQFDAPIVETYDVIGTKDELFINANRWMISTFKDAKSVIQYSDKDQGVLMGKYILYNKPAFVNAYAGTPEVNVFAIIEITVKDGKARISITPDSYNDTQVSDGMGGVINSYSKEQATIDMDALCFSFKKGIQTTKVEF